MWCIKCGRQGKNESCDYCGGLMVDYNPKDKEPSLTIKTETLSSDGGYCLRCGKYSGKGHKVCAYCGGALSKEPKSYKIISEFENDRTTAGVLLSFFLGFVGLLIGYGLFKHGTKERYTFLEGYAKTQIALAIIAVVTLLVLVFMGVGFLAMIK